MARKKVTELLDFIRTALQNTLSPILCQQYAWWLLQYITNKDELSLISTSEIDWNQDQENKLKIYLDQIIKHDKPLQYIIGSTPFAGLEILCQPPILIPRPETEEWTVHLIEQLEPLKISLSILDLCTGSGCIALALADALPASKVVATDINEQAIALAQQNAMHNGITNIEFIKSNLFDQIPDSYKFDLIVSNPPYIAPEMYNALSPSVKNWEDKQALTADDDGLFYIKKIIKQAPEYLKNNRTLADKNIAQLFIEIDFNQAKATSHFMQENGYGMISIFKDLYDNDRVIAGSMNEIL